MSYYDYCHTWVRLMNLLCKKTNKMVRDHRSILSRHLAKQAIYFWDKCQINKLLNPNVIFYELIVYLSTLKLHWTDVARFVEELILLLNSDRAQMPIIKVKEINSNVIDKSNVKDIMQSIRAFQKLDDNLPLWNLLTQFDNGVFNDKIKWAEFIQKTQLFMTWDTPKFFSLESLETETGNFYCLMVNPSEHLLEKILLEDTAAEKSIALRRNRSVTQESNEVLILSKNNGCFCLNTLLWYELTLPYTSLKHLILHEPWLSDIHSLFSSFVKPSSSLRNSSSPHLEDITLTQKRMTMPDDSRGFSVFWDCIDGQNLSENYTLILTIIEGEDSCQYEVNISGKADMYSTMLRQNGDSFILLNVSYLSISSRINYVQRLENVDPDLLEMLRYSLEFLYIQDQPWVIWAQVIDSSRIHQVSVFEHIDLYFYKRASSLRVEKEFKAFLAEVMKERKSKGFEVNIYVFSLMLNRCSNLFDWANGIKGVAYNSWNYSANSHQVIRFIKAHSLDLKMLELTHHLPKSYVGEILALMKKMTKLETLFLCFDSVIDAVSFWTKLSTKRYDSHCGHLNELVIEYCEASISIKSEKVKERYVNCLRKFIKNRPGVAFFEFVNRNLGGEAIDFSSETQALRRHIKVVFN
jgi:hypothetical protein